MILNPTTINIRDSHVMAIINLTPDSFYASSRNASYSAARESVERAVNEGATIVDLGGYSSRPGAEQVSVDEEWRRVEMGLRAVRDAEVGIVVSIDTFRSEIVRRAYEGYGAFIVNDISAGEADDAMIATVAELGLPYVAMHMRGTPETMQSMTEYAEGVTQGVVDYFRERVKVLETAGIDNIILDPGFGFAKTTEQNYELLAGLEALRALGYPLLIGVSRKSMIYRALGITPQEALPGSLALAWEALRSGDAIIRVHDVAATHQVVELAKYYKLVGYDKG
jgi:dihydropteroate synthase